MGRKRNIFFLFTMIILGTILWNADCSKRFMQEIRYMGLHKQATSEPRILSCGCLERDALINLTDKDYEVLLRIVEAEAGGEDEEGKMLVANVILNRVLNDKFPDTVTEVVFQSENGKAQFSPVADGRYDRVKVSEDTIEAVDKVLEGENSSEGALYFVSRKNADPEKMKWFDNHLRFLFQHGGHEFFM